ncbi:hypothetical protein V1264_007852 [Littorina saxatilis]|uniref:Uncharacterized protein n=1 Tax=Littorina saxatilis TaxID=31220 RepID=A0AAN9AVU0_9CAEN
MVDSIVVQSALSNCEEEDDHFLLSLETLQQEDGHSTPLEDVPLPLQYQSGEHADILRMAFAFPADNLSIQEENILTYISGYIARKLTGKVCSGCRGLLVGPLRGDRKEIFLTKKQLPDMKGEGLTVPSQQLVELMEVSFKKSEQLLHMDRVRTRIILRLEKNMNGSLTCPSTQCKLNNLIVQLFTNIRLHFVLKDNNNRFSSSSKRKSRKFLKLEYL